jgi:DNA-binding XRE family transcriptional regulator
MLTSQLIRGSRAMLGLTQAALAEAAGISAVTMNAIESGKTDPKSSTLRAIQTALEDRGAIFDTAGGVRVGPPLAEQFHVPPGAAGDREATTLAMAIVNLQRRRLGLRPFILEEDD